LSASGEWLYIQYSMLLELVSRSVLFASTWHGMCEFGAVLQWRLFYTPGPDMGRVPVGPVVGSERPAFPGCGSAVLPRFLGATANGQHLLWPLVLRGFEHHAGRSGRLTSPHSAAAICAVSTRDGHSQTRRISGQSSSAVSKRGNRIYSAGR